MGGKHVKGAAIPRPFVLEGALNNPGFEGQTSHALFAIESMEKFRFGFSERLCF